MTACVKMTPRMCSNKPCTKEGVARCSVCKIWYCSRECQEEHWPIHWRECLPLPDLEWPQVKTSEIPPPLKQGSSVSTLNVPIVTAAGAGGDIPHDVVKVGSAKLIQEDKKKDDHPKPVTAEIKITETIKVAEAKAAPVEVSYQSTPVKIQDKVTEEPRKEPDATPPPADPKPVKDLTPPASTTSAKTSSSSMYPEVHVSSKLAPQTLRNKCCEILPVEEATSPSQFIIRLTAEV